jgi:hypothetical protein
MQEKVIKKSKAKNANSRNCFLDIILLNGYILTNVELNLE